MCLAVPGQITHILNTEPLTRLGRVQFGGVFREVNLSLVPEADVGDYVLVHVGIALSRIEESEAARVLEALEAIGEPPEVETAP